MEQSLKPKKQHANYPGEERMTLQDSSSQKTFKNAFAPPMENGELGMRGVITGLRFAVLVFVCPLRRT